MPISSTHIGEELLLSGSLTGVIFIPVTPDCMPEPPRALNPPSPRDVAAQQRRMILQEAEQGLLAQRVNKPGPINNRDEEITFHGTRAFRSPVARWLPWLHEAPVEITLDYVDDMLDE